jgi:hypothetical protein
MVSSSIKKIRLLTDTKDFAANAYADIFFFAKVEHYIIRSQ